MLKHRLIHPKINEVLGRAGHHGKILIADGNYPASSAIGPNAELVSLNLMPGVVDVHAGAPGAAQRDPDRGGQHDDVRADGPYALTGRPAGLGGVPAGAEGGGVGLELAPIEKWEFYKAVATPDHVLTIQTADQQRFANLLLTIGVRMD